MAILPKLAPAVYVAFGLLKLVLLNRLNDSILNCSFALGPTGMFLASAKSNVAAPGPRKPLRAVLPNVPKAAGVNAAGLNHTSTSEPEGAAGSPI